MGVLATDILSRSKRAAAKEQETNASQVQCMQLCGSWQCGHH